MPVGNDEEAPLGDFIEDAEATSAENAVIAGLLHSDVRTVLGTLDEREQQVIRLRYGLDDGQPRTLDQIGKLFGSVARAGSADRTRSDGQASRGRTRRAPSRIRQLTGRVSGEDPRGPGWVLGDRLVRGGVTPGGSRGQRRRRGPKSSGCGSGPTRTGRRSGPHPQGTRAAARRRDRAPRAGRRREPRSAGPDPPAPPCSTGAALRYPDSSGAAFGASISSVASSSVSGSTRYARSPRRSEMTPARPNEMSAPNDGSSCTRIAHPMPLTAIFCTCSSGSPRHRRKVAVRDPHGFRVDKIEPHPAQVGTMAPLCRRWP